MNRITELINKGVSIPNPASVDIGEEVDIRRISGEKVILYSGCKIYGKNTYICNGVQIGREGPVTIENCYLGNNASLKGGFFQEAVFLDSSSCGMGAHVRKGTILEEKASIAHAVGLKQTILFPFVTLGSLINFCDCLMAGGTSNSNHSEVGSSYIHFNYTPNQDKATPSLIGDVPRGVMLNQSPIFLGGQGGLVGPCRITYGTVLAAGSICRKDQLKANRLVIAGQVPNASMPLQRASYRNLRRVLEQNFYYIGNLMALMQWYRLVRSQFVGRAFAQPLLDGLIRTLQNGIDERIKQLEQLKDKVEASGAASSKSHASFCRHWDQIKTSFQKWQTYEGDSAFRDRFLAGLEIALQQNEPQYVPVIQSLDAELANEGSQWLQDIVEHLTAAVFSILSPEK